MSEWVLKVGGRPAALLRPEDMDPIEWRRLKNLSGFVRLERVVPDRLPGLDRDNLSTVTRMDRKGLW